MIDRRTLSSSLLTTLDVGEKRNVTDRHPEVATRLLRQTETIRAELGDVGVAGSDQRKINLVDPQER